MLVANVFRPRRLAIPVNGNAARRDTWAGRIERCLASAMTVKEWCALNKVAESSSYKWMARFRKKDPERFPRRSSEASVGSAASL